MTGYTMSQKARKNAINSTPAPAAARVVLIADDDLNGWQRYPECVADQPDTPIDDEIEGDLLQYSSGTTGRPKGIKRPLPHLPPAEVPGMMEMLVSVWMGPGAVYLSPAPLYHTAPSVWSTRSRAAPACSPAPPASRSSGR